jgi:ribosome recycling factor
MQKKNHANLNLHAENEGAYIKISVDQVTKNDIVTSEQ